MPRPSPRSFGDVPLQSGSSHTLGIKVKSRNNAFYFLAARGALRRYGRRFPLTEEGWRAAWTAFAAEDPAGAALYRDSRGPSSSGSSSGARAIGAGEVADDGWMWVLLGGIGWICAVALGYEGIRHMSVMIVLIGAALAFCSLVATLYGLVIEGIRLARRTS
ncbi:MAG TPA: hypothetical protein VFJ09_14510 [Nocardioidaceae bacterium]|nr:hypothetical protein [Nocardioidaceae bacterium]